MSKWNDFCDGVSKTTKKTADKTKSIANKTSLKVKLGNLEAKASEEYDTLGRTYYTQKVGKVDSEDALRAQIKIISDINKQINQIHAELREIKRLEAEQKAAAEAEKAARKEAKAAAKAARENDQPIDDEDDEDDIDDAVDDDDDDEDLSTPIPTEDK